MATDNKKSLTDMKYIKKAQKRIYVLWLRYDWEKYFEEPIAEVVKKKHEEGYYKYGTLSFIKEAVVEKMERDGLLSAARKDDPLVYQETPLTKEEMAAKAKNKEEKKKKAEAKKAGTKEIKE